MTSMFTKAKNICLGTGSLGIIDPGLPGQGSLAG